MSGFPLPVGKRVPPGSGFRVTVLGRAGSFPAPGEATTGLLLSTDTTHVLVDCGAGVLSNLLQVLSPGLLSAVLITHLHPDHISDLMVLGHLVRHGLWPNQADPGPLPVYLPAGPEERLASFPSDEGLERRFYDEDQSFSIGDINLAFRITTHTIHCLAVRAQHGQSSLVFTADTGPSPSVTELATGASLLISELSMPDTMAGAAEQVGHLTPRTAARLAVDAQVRRALMTHFVMGYDADKLVVEARVAAQAMARSAGRAAPNIEPAGLLRTYPV